VPIDPTGVAHAMSTGLSAVCATCKKYWEARDHGVPGTGCLTKVKCGSPIAGDVFSDYEGPLNNALHLWCFVCARASDLGVRVQGKSQVIGVCRAHLSYIAQFQAVGGPETRAEVRDADGPLIAPSAPKKSLAQAINEVESYFAEKEEG
jgi:hypothetical protein